MPVNALQVDRSDIQKIRQISSAANPLEEGQVRVKLDNFALTANNITYAATGDRIGYWKFFPSGDDEWGIVPVWGFAEVSESRCPDVHAGERLYGFFPMAEEWVLSPVKISARGFTDGAPHRAELAAVYNRYARLTSAGSVKEPSQEAEYALLHPLYTTSWLIYDFLVDNDFFGAEQILVGSASSKTAIGVLELLHRHKASHNKSIIGLTSARNLGFVQQLAMCDRVLNYDEIRDKIDIRPTVFVDMSGNSQVRTDVHQHLEDKLTYSCAVGASHWDQYEDPVSLPGARPTMFFAPSQLAKRRQEWGAGIVEGRIAQDLERVIAESTGWMTVIKSRGFDALAQRYTQIVEGKAPANEGYSIQL